MSGNDHLTNSNASANLINSEHHTTDSISAIKYTQQAQKLSYTAPAADSDGSGTAVEAMFITPHDPIIKTADGGRLPGVPLAEASQLNAFKAEVEGQSSDAIESVERSTRHDKIEEEKGGEGSLRRTMPPSRTHPLFPPLPLYGPSSLARDLQCFAFRSTAFFLSLTFLGVIVLGSAFTSLPLMFKHIWLRLTFRDPDARRPFHVEEKRRRLLRAEEAKSWKRGKARRNSKTKLGSDKEDEAAHGKFVPTEGGPDPLICDVGYYARRVGLDVEEYEVQTEDGFLITLWHVFNPLEHAPRSSEDRKARGPDVFVPYSQSSDHSSSTGRKPKFPVLMIHGLLQSSGAYCTNDDNSLAFYLCKSGYDVWLGNNRCGFKPKHTLLNYSDPRMWAWNIRQMGVMDLPALTSRVLSETGFKKIGLIAHSQGTTQTFVALAKEQRPDIGDKLTVFCALAPAAYAGPLIGKAYFKFMRVISPAFFRLIFGVHAFIPLMMTMHQVLPGSLYGAMGYRVFSFLFNWTDDRWERDLRDRMFQFAPVYVSAESMRWWLGRECFAKQKCILATKEEGKLEDHEDELEDYYEHVKEHPEKPMPALAKPRASSELRKHKERVRKPKGTTAWYDEHVPPFALWVGGSDELVDGRRLLRRFERGREPHVRVVHAKVIDEYEHLDVIWAMDALEQVGSEVKEVLWQTAGEEARSRCKVPKGCEEIEAWIDDRKTKKGAIERNSRKDLPDDEDQTSSSSEDK